MRVINKSNVILGYVLLSLNAVALNVTEANNAPYSAVHTIKENEYQNNIQGLIKSSSVLCSDSLNSGNWDEAIQWADQSIAYLPREIIDGKILANNISSEEKKFLKASYQGAISKKGLAYWRMGEPDKAVWVLKNYLKFYPESIYVKNELEKAQQYAATKHKLLNAYELAKAQDNTQELVKSLLKICKYYLSDPIDAFDPGMRCADQAIAHLPSEIIRGTGSTGNFSQQEWTALKKLYSKAISEKAVAYWKKDKYIRIQTGEAQEEILQKGMSVLDNYLKIYPEDKRNHDLLKFMQTYAKMRNDK